MGKVFPADELGLREIRSTVDTRNESELPNLYAAADGTARAELFSTRVSVSDGELPALLDEAGSAVIIHENSDDHVTQPIGGAGGRIGCGNPCEEVNRCSGKAEDADVVIESGVQCTRKGIGPPSTIVRPSSGASL